jgi:hypothetical protein
MGDGSIQFAHNSQFIFPMSGKQLRCGTALRGARAMFFQCLENSVRVYAIDFQYS